MLKDPIKRSEIIQNLIIIAMIISIMIPIMPTMINKAKEYSNTVFTNKNNTSNQILFYKDGTPIYFNPETGTKCDKDKATSITGAKSGCLKWYTFNDTENSKKVKMILDHNTTAYVAYNSDVNNEKMKELAKRLIRDTSTWKKNLNPSIISAEEITEIIGYSKWNPRDYSQQVNFETKTEFKPDKYSGTYAWLYENTNNCTKYGCKNACNTTYGYWTSTKAFDDYSAWYVHGNGVLDMGMVDHSRTIGLRPVITVDKINLN